MYVPHFAYSFLIDGHLNCFHFLSTLTLLGAWVDTAGLSLAKNKSIEQERQTESNLGGVFSVSEIHTRE